MLSRNVPIAELHLLLGTTFTFGLGSTLGEKQDEFFLDVIVIVTSQLCPASQVCPPLRVPLFQANMLVGSHYYAHETRTRKIPSMAACWTTLVEVERKMGR